MKSGRAFSLGLVHDPTVKLQTEEFLYEVLWMADTILNPTWNNLLDNFETWAARKGLLRRLHELERRRFLERSPTAALERVLQLTESGRLHALGGRDPEACWARPWDRRWRLVIFDVPTNRNSARCRLRRHFRARHFGYLQDSVWISPDPMNEERQLLQGAKVDVESLLFLEAHPCGGESDADIAAGAWDFTRINEAYTRYLAVLKKHPRRETRGDFARRAIQAWIRNEQSAWLEAIELDPLLPKCLCPTGYLGPKAWDVGCLRCGRNY
jgi:DNA-binding transcriptional regulator PaaX